MCFRDVGINVLMYALNLVTCLQTEVWSVFKIRCKCQVPQLELPYFTYILPPLLPFQIRS